MTIITDSEHKVVSVSLIPGLGSVPSDFHVYFPAKCKELPSEGDTYIECDWAWPLPGSDRFIPETGHAGSFGAVRKFDIHCGVDLYCDLNQEVVAVEDGVVVALDIFTGVLAGSPWWNETYAVYVEGESGVVVYGEIKPTEKMTPGCKVKRGDLIGNVITVLRKDKGLPMNMLHLELHKKGTRTWQWWNLESPKPDTLIDPTIYLKMANWKLPMHHHYHD